MRFRVAGRHDPLLIAGFAFALLLVFQRSFQYLLAVAADIEKTYGVALVPALLILSVMLVFHLHGNRREVRLEAAASAHEAELARARTRELEQLMTFGQSLSRALTLDALHETVWRHLPALAGGSDLWMLVRRNGEWERVTDRACARWPAGTIEAVADLVIESSPEDFERPDGIARQENVCHVITSGGRVAGVLGTPQNEASANRRRTIGTAASLLGIALHNVQLFTDVREHSLRDALTGCFNRAHGLDTLDTELARARRGDSQLSVLLFDIDHFKRINDGCGHLSGDAILAAVGQRLRQVLRRSDFRCRYGGDEFLILLPETPTQGAMRVAEWVRSEIEQISIAGRDQDVKPTVSVGVATAISTDSTDELVDRADRALYAAKAAGRNCVRSLQAPVAVQRPALTAVAV